MTAVPAENDLPVVPVERDSIRLVDVGLPNAWLAGHLVCRQSRIAGIVAKQLDAPRNRLPQSRFLLARNLLEGVGNDDLRRWSVLVVAKKPLGGVSAVVKGAAATLGKITQCLGLASLPVLRPVVQLVPGDHERRT